jgi:ElaB/YqjD/DUF883 family membrane-anchored ribosome-binding protein
MDKKKEYLKELKENLDNYTQQLSNIKKGFQQKSGRDVQDISKSLEAVLGNARTAYAQLASASEKDWEKLNKLASEAFDDLSDSFAQAIHPAADQIKEYAAKVAEQYEDQMQDVEKYIKHHPFKSILLSLGIGFIIGKLMK